MRNVNRGRRPVFLLGSCLCLPLLLTGCVAGPGAQSGSLVGGFAGAVTGASLARRGNPVLGAALGGVTGALAGNAIGAGIDANAAANDAIIRQQLGRSLQGTVSVNDVIAMQQAGVSPSVIENHIRTHGTARLLSTDEVLQLSRSQVPDQVIKTMQASVRGNAPLVRPAVPVVVEEHYVVPGPAYCPPPRYGWRPRPARIARPGFNFGVSVRR